MKRLTTTLILGLCLLAGPIAPAQTTIDVQGHRGARGLMPENSVPGFITAMDIGVQTLEMDVVISKDNRVVVSHEPFMSHEICLDPQGKPIDEAEEKTHNIYEMTYAQVQRYDCGSKVHPDFTGQTKLKTNKPLLTTVIDTVKNYEATHGRNPVWYSIEIKSSPAGDGKYHPKPGEFVRLVLAVIREKNIEDRMIIQSFDLRALQVADSLAPDIPLALLVENDIGLRANIQDLGFIPEIYSPHHSLVDKDMLTYAKVLDMKVIPWTVNKKSHMRKLIRMGVDGLITDYPDLAVTLAGNKNQ